MTEFLHGVQVVNIDTGARSIAIASSSVIGIVGTAPLADTEAFPINTPVLVTSPSQAAKLSATTGADAAPCPVRSTRSSTSAVVVVVRVEKGANESATLANVLGGVNARPAPTKACMPCWRPSPSSASSRASWSHRASPMCTHRSGQAEAVLANPVVAELLGIADKLRAVIIKDGPNSNDDAAKSTAALTGSKRVYVVDPALLVQSGDAIVTRYASGAVAGAIARSDNERGWWASPSNLELNGVVGTARAIDFGLSDATSRANLLNQANVATVIREGGFRLWGNRTTSIDPKWQFLCVVRTADIIADSLEAAHLWAVDRGISKTYVDDVREGVNAFLRGLKTQGAILGGNCWIDPELNAADSVAQGRFYWDFDFTPTYPGEQLTFRMHMNNNYVSEIF
jgi:phage tail sheath protein FI